MNRRGKLIILSNLGMGTLVSSILSLLIFTFMARASNNMVQTTVPLVAKEYFNASETEVGLLSGVFSISSFIATALVNARLGSSARRIMFEASVIVYFITFLIYPFVNYVGLWLISALFGYLLGIIMPNLATASSLIGNTQEVRERVIALYTFALSLSLTVGPLIESLILRYFTLRYAFLFFSALSAVMIPLSFRLPFPTESNSKAKFKLSEVWARAGFRVAVYNNSMYNLPFAMLTAFGGIYAIRYFHVSNSIVYLLFSLFFTASFISRLYMAMRPIKDIGKASILMSILTLIGVALMALSWNVATYAFALIILGIPHGLTYPISLILISRDSKDYERNLLNSAFSAIMTIIGVVTPMVLGIVAGLMGLRLMVIFVEVSVIILTLLLYNSLRELNGKWY